MECFLGRKGTFPSRRENRQGVGELVLDLHAEIPGLGPVDRRVQTLAAHPTEQGEHAGGSGLAFGDQRGKGVPEMDDVADRWSGARDPAMARFLRRMTPCSSTWTASRSIGEVAWWSASCWSCASATRRRMCASWAGRNGCRAFSPLGERDAGQEFVGVETKSGLVDRFINRADQRMIHGRLGADVREKRFPLVRFGSPGVHPRAPCVRRKFVRPARSGRRGFQREVP